MERISSIRLWEQGVSKILIPCVRPPFSGDAAFVALLPVPPVLAASSLSLEYYPFRIEPKKKKLKRKKREDTARIIFRCQFENFSKPFFPRAMVPSSFTRGGSVWEEEVHRPVTSAEPDASYNLNPIGRRAAVKRPFGLADSPKYSRWRRVFARFGLLGEKKIPRLIFPASAIRFAAARFLGLARVSALRHPLFGDSENPLFWRGRRYSDRRA